MESLGEKGSRMLDEAAGVCDLLRLAHSTLHRMQRDLHGETYNMAIRLSGQLHLLREDCNRFYSSVDKDVEDFQKGSEAI